MKYCMKCGTPMEDDMLFCQKCGAKAITSPCSKSQKSSAVKQEFSKPKASHSIKQFTNIPGTQTIHSHTPPSTKQTRIVLMALSIVCFSFAGFYACVAIMVPMMLSMTIFLGILGVMFFVLSNSPKGNAHILDKQAGLKKASFVVISIITAFSLTGFSIAVLSTLTAPVSDAQETFAPSNDQTAETKSLADIQKWYEDQMPTVGQNLMEYAKAVDGLTYLNVNESKFFFGGEWDDCYYKFSFTCTVNAETYIGEARAFMKYLDSEINWFSFEIFDNDSIQSLVELYDDSYDQIIIDYYHELETLYS